MYPQQRLSAATPDIANLAVQMGRPVCPTAYFEQQLPRNELTSTLRPLRILRGKWGQLRIVPFGFKTMRI